MASSYESSDRPHAIYPSLQGKTVLITGGAQGIGAAAAELFLKQGCKVIILDIDLNSITALCTALVSKNLKAPIFYPCDVADITALQTTATQVLADHGTINVLLNNAASSSGTLHQTTETMTPETWDANMNVNLRHQFFLTQALVPAMKASKQGSIINMGSISWRIPAAGVPAYTTAKAAIVGLTRTHAKEFGPWGIRVNSVMPGAIATERQRREVLTEEYRAEVMAAQSLQRDLLPEEVARVIVFLASDEASAVTGSSYVVDGGWCSDP